ncbi:hypothetical protein B0T19DRAFT_269566 [Cercophora scortea]|uniref:Short-chain dehydrogenase n=1 Tax=Cercophora scortea TaxID=314031 RepID=A0AAE0I6L2_9PEZI|nr:hypothetical protein B0T19DRAFT_269566 [Cercophora scortea]
MAPYTSEASAVELVSDLAHEITGKVILITGVSPGGLGAVFAETISKAQPGLLILAGRTPSKVQQTADAVTKTHPGVKTRTLHLDLGSLQGARDAAAEMNGWTDVPAIDVLVNNAGIMATDFKLTPDGVECQFATNHLAPFLFTNLIMGKVVAAKAPRVVNVSSDGHRLNHVRFDDYNFRGGETYNKWFAYGQSKTANMLFALSLAEKLGQKKGLLAFSLHPGVIRTNLSTHLDWEVDVASLRAADKMFGNAEAWREFTFRSPEQGAATHVYAAFHPELKDHNGAYLQDSHVADPWTDTVKPWGTSLVEAERLWKLSEKLVGQEFSY